MNDTALRLADALEQQFPIGTAQHYLDGEAAVELRRLHQSEREGWRWADELEQERKRLHALNAELVEALRVARAEFDGLPHSLGYAFTHIPKIDAALAKVEASNGS